MSRFNRWFRFIQWSLEWWATRSLTSLALSLLLFAGTGCDAQRILAPESSSGTAPTSEDVRTDKKDRIGPRQFELFRAVHLEGRSETGALWVIDAPVDWNGDLVVYLHGYTNPALPVALPGIDAIRDSLLERGFAVAASSYSSNGYAVREGMRDSRQLSNVFASQVTKPGRTYLLGQSLGGLIGLLLTQKYPDQYDGSLLVSGIVGGSDDEMQYLGDIRVLFDAVYPGVLEGDLEHPPVITDIDRQVVQPVVQAVQANPQGVGIIQALARRPLPGRNGGEITTSLVNVLGLAMQGGGDLFERAHGHYFDNATWQYSSPQLPPALVADINARVARYAIDAQASVFLSHYGEPAGGPLVPVITMHKTEDPLVPIFHEDLLANVAAGPWLVQKRVTGYGHADFLAGELMVSFDELVNRVANPALVF